MKSAAGRLKLSNCHVVMLSIKLVPSLSASARVVDWLSRHQIGIQYIPVELEWRTYFRILFSAECHFQHLTLKWHPQPVIHFTVWLHWMCTLGDLMCGCILVVVVIGVRLRTHLSVLLGCYDVLLLWHVNIWLHWQMYQQNKLHSFYCLLWLPYGIGQTIIFSSCGFFFPRLISAITDWMCAILPHMVWP